VLNELTCFKAYDVRGELGVNFDGEVAYRIARAFVVRLAAKSVVVGYDARESSQFISRRICQAIRDGGADVFDLGLCGTEEMYFSTGKLKASGGIQITASHNPIGYNGLKMIGMGAKPLDPNKEILDIKSIAEKNYFEKVKSKGSYEHIGQHAREAYVQRVISFTDLSKIKPMKIVINSGNGAAGPTFDKISKEIAKTSKKLEFVRMFHEPNSSFPNGIPNPMLKENQMVTSRRILSENADFGIAFDGDFDRCFFFDDKGKFIHGEYVIGLLLGIFLSKEIGGSIVHDPRVVWNIKNLISQFGGLAVQSKTGHAFIKQKMREKNATYGGEISGHHYFRDFFYCDSGMIPWLVLCEALGRQDEPLSMIIAQRKKLFPSLGEMNFRVKNPVSSINKVIKWCEKSAISLDFTDGVSAEFSDWRFNLRLSNTEDLVRLNLETSGSTQKVKILSDTIKNILLSD
jgi:phosphomannomutase